MRALVLAAALIALNGCAYYNGMYNANQLAGRAEKAEREGRTLDAGNYWGQVVVKTDSVLRRHPDSKWADDARLLRGRALARLGDCATAVPELVRAQHDLDDPDLIEAALLELGRCRLALDDPAGAQVALAPLAESADDGRRRAALALLGRARFAAGDYDGALELIGAAGSAPAGDTTLAGTRLVALAGAGRLDQARLLADSLLAARSAGVPWGVFVAEFAETDPVGASDYLDRLTSLEVPGATRAAWLVADAGRLMDRDRPRALARLEQAERLAPESDPGAIARLRRLRIRLAEVARPESLGGLLAEATAPAGTPAWQLLSAARLVQRTADSTTAVTPQGDLALFLAAELARDSLRSPQLASHLLRRVVDEWPESPYAPKALLAMLALGTEAAPDLREDLEILYGQSPYVAVSMGVADSTYRTLEDSLGTFAAAWRASAAAGPDGPGRQQPGRPAITPERPGVTPERPGAAPERPGVTPEAARRTRPGAAGVAPR